MPRPVCRRIAICHLYLKYFALVFWYSFNLKVLLFPLPFLLCTNTPRPFCFALFAFNASHC